jgi:hypothetical protein
MRYYRHDDVVPVALRDSFSKSCTNGSKWLQYPSVTESDAEALVAQPVHITVNRDIGVALGTGDVLFFRDSPCEHRVTGRPAG